MFNGVGPFLQDNIMPNLTEINEDSQEMSEVFAILLGQAKITGLLVSADFAEPITELFDKHQCAYL